MKLSQLSKEELGQLSPDLVKSLVYSGIEDLGEKADVALLLGTCPLGCESRARWAAKMYLEGRVRYVIPSGGVEHTFPCGNCTEAEFMEKILLEAGVPQEAILLENEARTTKENMVCGVFQITRKLMIQNVKSVMIVTSAVHMRRSLALAQLFMPRSIRITFSPAPDDIQSPEYHREDTAREISLLQDLIRQGLTEEVEFA